MSRPPLKILQKLSQVPTALQKYNRKFLEFFNYDLIHASVRPLFRNDLSSSWYGILSGVAAVLTRGEIIAFAADAKSQQVADKMALSVLNAEPAK